MKRKQIIDLWQRVFADSEEFIRLYFDHVYKEENTLTIAEDGRVLSALQILSYQMNYYGSKISVGYISGASTLPSEQGKGLMRKLLKEAFREMKKRKITITALIPAEEWLFGYYESEGYTSIFDYSIEKYILPDSARVFGDLSIADQTLFSPEELFVYLNRKLCERSISILHSLADFSVIMNDLSISGGQLFTAVNSEKELVGMAFALPTNQKHKFPNVYIKEICYNNEKIKAFLLQNMALHYKVNEISFKVPCYNKETFRLGMAAILDPEHLIQLWKKAHPQSDLSTDKMRGMTEQQLMYHLFDYSHKTAYMSLMLD